jgi:hypothetical protein
VHTPLVRAHVDTRMSSSRVAPSDAILPPTPEPDEEEDCIDLTSDHEEASGGCLGVASQRHRGETASHPATARRSVPGSVLAQAPSPKLLMQQQLMRDFEVKKQQASGGGGSITAYLQPASTPAPQQISHDTIPSHQPSHHGKPRLQLSSITHTVPSQPAASFAPLHRQPPQPLMKTEPYSLFNQRSQGMKTESTYGSAAAASHTAAAASTPAAAAASPSHWQASQWQSQSQATPSFTPPANHLLSTQRPLPHSAPPSRNQRPPPAAPAAAASSHQPPQRPLATNTPAAAASSTSVYVPNAEEQLVARRTSLQDQLAELDDEEKVIANKRRGIKAELRKIEEELKKPMQLPYTQAVSNVPVLVIGGVSALISGSPHWAGAFPWDQAAMEMLQGVFGIQSYRISQREVINATMDRKDVFCVMPTGAGTSKLASVALNPPARHWSLTHNLCFASACFCSVVVFREVVVVSASGDVE